MLLDRQFDDGVGPVIEEALEAGETLFGVTPYAVGDLDVLALDDGPHDHLREVPQTDRFPWAPTGTRRSAAEVAAARGLRGVYRRGRGPPAEPPTTGRRAQRSQRSRATVTAETAIAPASVSACAQALSAAPVVTTSSTRTIHLPSSMR